MSVIRENPNSPSQNIIQATADVPDLTFRPFSDVQTSPMVRGQNAAGTINTFVIGPTGFFGVGPVPAPGNNGPYRNWFIAGDDNHDGTLFQLEAGASNFNQDTVVAIRDQAGLNIANFYNAGIVGAYNIQFQSTAPTNKTLSVQDSGGGHTAPIFDVFSNAFGNVVFQVGPGTMGCFGVPLAPQQIGGAATATLVYTATEQAMIQKAYNCLRTFGWLT